MSNNRVYCEECNAIRAWERTFTSKDTPATAEMSCGHVKSLTEIFDAMLPYRRTYPNDMEYR